MRTTLAIPCYNAAHFLDSTLRAVLALSPPPDSIIVVDDGSSDHSAELVRSYPDIELCLHERNRGIAAARNTALRHSDADIIVYIDADTIPRRSLIGALKKHYVDDGVAGVGGRALEVCQRSSADRLRREILFQGWGDTYRIVPFLFGLCSSFRTEALRKVGGFDVAFGVSGEDMDACYRLRQAGFRFLYEPAAVVDHMRTDDRDNLMKMTYRHCFWGFLAQRKHRRYEHKVPLVKSAGVLLKQTLIDGIAKGDLPLLRMTLSMHYTILQAWIDSGRHLRRRPLSRRTHFNCTSWEGHGAASPDSVDGRPMD